MIQKMKYQRILAFSLLFVLSLATASTTIKVFIPTAPDVLNETLDLDKITEGACQSSLVSTGRNDVYRCINKANKVFDPCFSRFGEKNLICMKSPWEDDAVIFTPTKKPTPPENSKPLLETLPWAIKLKNRKTCVLNTGASAVLASMRVQYLCEDDSFLLGDIHKAGNQWSIFFYQADKLFARMVDIDQAVF